MSYAHLMLIIASFFPAFLFPPCMTYPVSVVRISRRRCICCINIFLCLHLVISLHAFPYIPLFPSLVHSRVFALPCLSALQVPYLSLISTVPSNDRFEYRLIRVL